MQVDQTLSLVVVVEAGRHVIGFVDHKKLETERPIEVKCPMVLIEQYQPGGKVNVALVPVLVSMVVETLYVAELSSYVFVPHTSPLAENYQREWENRLMQQRAAHAGIVMASTQPKVGPHPGNNGPVLAGK